jgi:hypothetical protein
MMSIFASYFRTGEFSALRGSTGSNEFMSAADCMYGIRGRNLQILARLDALDAVTAATSDPVTCRDCEAGVHEVAGLDTLLNKVERLSDRERLATVYIAGYLLRCDPEFDCDGEEPVAVDSDFLDFLSRGQLLLPPKTVTWWVQMSLAWFDAQETHQITCQKHVQAIIETIGASFLEKPPSNNMARRLSKVLLNGVHKKKADQTEKDSRRKRKGDETSTKLKRISGCR